MKLLYCYSEFYDQKGSEAPFRELSKFELNLSTNQTFEYNKRDNCLSMCDRGKPIPFNFWENGVKESNIYNINAVVGKNGSGKTTITKYVTELLSCVFSGLDSLVEDIDQSREKYCMLIKKHLQQKQQ